MKIVLPDSTITYQTKDDDGTPDGGTLTLRVPTKAEVSRIRRKYTTEKWKHGTRIIDVDWDAAAADLVDAVVIAWEGITDVHDHPLPCERVFKLALPSRVVQDVFDVTVGGNWRGEGDEGNAPASSASI